jgi:hypothetical protein
MGNSRAASTTPSSGGQGGQVPIDASRELDRYHSPNRGSIGVRRAKTTTQSKNAVIETQGYWRDFKKLQNQENKGNYIQSRGRRRLRTAPSAQGIPGEELPFAEELGGSTTLFPAGFKDYHRQVSCISTKLLIENYITLQTRDV